MTDSNEFNESTHSSAFPAPAREQIPADCMPLIDDGNAEFFAFLREDFPQTYSQLLELPAQCLDAYFSACLRDPDDDTVVLAAEAKSGAPLPDPSLNRQTGSITNLP